MEQVHGVDVSWMSNAAPKADKNGSKLTTTTPTKPALSQTPPSDVQRPRTTSTSTQSVADSPTQQNGSAPMQIPKRRARAGSTDKAGSAGTSPNTKRSSWFSSISSKFSSSPGNTNGHNGAGIAQQSPENSLPEQLASSPAAQSPQPISQTTTIPEEVPEATSIPRSGHRNAVLPPAAKTNDNGPYTPAPPKSQGSMLGIFRRLSSSGASNGGGKPLGNGLVERKVLNVDRNRERCAISELKDAKLRRVAFCVDVEIAPMPRYSDGDAAAKPKPIAGGQKTKLTEKGEGEALKNPKAMEESKDAGVDFSTPDTKAEDALTGTKSIDSVETAPGQGTEKGDGSKKKEKKKRSEEERKARKEKKRRLAEANGSIPMEIHYDSDDSEDSPSTTAGVEPPTTTSTTSKATSQPTTNPVRIYRRCCQLRETPILKKITEQLLDVNNYSSTSGIVYKLDLQGYDMPLVDLVTLGDFLAVVPVRAIVLDNAGIQDEGVRVVLAGLLAARRPDFRRRKPKHDLEPQGGVVEALDLKNNKLGIDGWKYISLFLYHCRSLKWLDLSNVPFPRQPAGQSGSLPNGKAVPRTISDVFTSALAARPGGSTLDLVSLSGTEPSAEQLGVIIDGVIKCGVKRLGLGHNNLTREGLQHVARYLEGCQSEGLDISGNDLRDNIDVIAEALQKTDMLWTLGLAGCNLDPSGLGKLLPILSGLKEFRFIDLSRNPDLFNSTPHAMSMLRRYLPKLQYLKRIHLRECDLTPEQAIAFIEVIPENQGLAHIDLFGNQALMALADANTEEAKEEACALYAALMAACRISKSMICVDIEAPSDNCGEIVKAMAKQVVAYCLRNVGRLQDNGVNAAVSAAADPANYDFHEDNPDGYPDVLAPLLGHDILDTESANGEGESAPDEDYVIGGTGVVKALTCCLKNRGGDESRRPSGEFVKDVDTGETVLRKPSMPTGKAKETSKHLLVGARKIRQRLQPAIQRAMANPVTDPRDLRKLEFLNETLEKIISKFEAEYPDTRESNEGTSLPSTTDTLDLSSSPPKAEGAISDNEDDTEIHPSRPLSRSNSMLSRSLAAEEGHLLRVGHQFRSGITSQEREEQMDILKSIDDMANDPRGAAYLEQLAEEVGGDFWEIAKQKGPTRAFKEDGALLQEGMEKLDPEHWDKFVESQRKARANIRIGGEGVMKNESAVVDD